MDGLPFAHAFGQILILLFVGKCFFVVMIVLLFRSVILLSNRWRWQSLITLSRWARQWTVTKSWTKMQREYWSSWWSIMNMYSSSQTMLRLQWSNLTRHLWNPCTKTWTRPRHFILHHALESHCPLVLVKALMEVFQNQVHQQDNDGRVPLHVALLHSGHGASVRIVTDAYPAAMSIPDPVTGLLPIEQALLNVGDDGSLENTDAVDSLLRRRSCLFVTMCLGVCGELVTALLLLLFEWDWLYCVDQEATKMIVCTILLYQI